LLALVATAVTGVPAVLRFVPVLKNPRVRKIVMAALLWGAALVVPLLGFATFLAFHIVAQRYAALIGCAIAILFLVSLCLNINLPGPHRLYRNGLAQTFVQCAKGESDTPLSAINPDRTAPYHLVNPALNLPSTTNPAVRDRRADFFLFSKCWSG